VCVRANLGMEWSVKVITVTLESRFERKYRESRQRVGRRTRTNVLQIRNWHLCCISAGNTLYVCELTRRQHFSAWSDVMVFYFWKYDVILSRWWQWRPSATRCCICSSIRRLPPASSPSPCDIIGSLYATQFLICSTFVLVHTQPASNAPLSNGSVGIVPHNLESSIYRILLVTSGDRSLMIRVDTDDKTATQTDHGLLYTRTSASI